MLSVLGVQKTGGLVGNYISRALASYIYTGALAPVGTANRLLDSGKNKTNLTINSGGATQFDATQSIPITFVSSDYTCYYKYDVLVEDTTIGQTSKTLSGAGTYRDFYAFSSEPNATQKAFMASYPERTFAHFSIDSTNTESVLEGLTCLLNMPLNQIGATQHDYATGADFTITNYTTSCDVVKQSTGLQMSQFEHEPLTGLMGEWKPDRMWFDDFSYVDQIQTNFRPAQDEPFAVECVMGKPDEDYNEIGTGFNRTRILRNSIGTCYVQMGGNSFMDDTLETQSMQMCHILLVYDGSTAYGYINGTLKGSSLALVQDTFDWAIPTFDTKKLNCPNSHFKIWQGDEYTKFDPAKSWAKAQALITKWEAE